MLHRESQVIEPESRMIKMDYLRDDGWFVEAKVDPRDIRLHVDIPTILSQSTQLSPNTTKQIRQWLVYTIEKITSDNFYRYSNGQLKQEEVKSLTSKNILINISNLLKSKSQINSQQIYKFIDKESKNILKTIISKYPQAEGKGGVRKFKKAITRTDNRENNQFDLLRFPAKTKVNFQYREDGIYFTEILKALKYITKISQNGLFENDDKITNFQGFNLLFENIFTQASCQQFKKQFNQNMFHYKQNKGLHNSKDFAQLFKIEGNPIDCYFKIGRKIPVNIKSFNKQDIEEGIFKLTDVSVLRVLTKWSEQLRDKLKNNKDQILRRVSLFKNKNGNLIQLTPIQRKCLCKAAEEQQQRIEKVMKELKQECKLMMTKLCNDEYDFLYANKIDGNTSVLAYRTQTCIAKYIFSYLNQLIHSLLKIPIQAEKLHPLTIMEQKVQAKQLLTVNLITFKIGDLMRCKCKATQNHAINIYNMLKQMSEKYPQILRIVRVKDRLDLKDNDILINIFFMNKIQCQVQLSVALIENQKKNNYAEYLDNYNHFLYQLIRAQFGPIVQSACILAQYDPIVKKLTQNISNLSQMTQKQYMNNNQIILLKVTEKTINTQQKKRHLKSLPFFCNQCCQFIENNNPQFYMKQNSSSACNICYQNFLISNKKQQKLLQQLFRLESEQKKQKIQKHFQLAKSNVFYKKKIFSSINANEEGQKNNQYKQKLFEMKKLNIGYIVSKSYRKPDPKYFQIIRRGQQLHFVIETSSKNKYQSKIILNLDQDWQKEFQNFYIIKLQQNKKINALQQQQNVKILNCSCCKAKKFKLGNIQNMKQELIINQNQKIICDTYNKQKQTLYLSKRQVTIELDKIKESNKIKRVYAFDNKIASMKFIEKLPNLIAIKLGNLKKYIRRKQNKIFLKNRLSSDPLINRFTKQLNRKNLEFIKPSFSQNAQVKYVLSNKGNNKIKNIENLQNLSFLQNLELFGNQITKIINVKKLINLKKLTLNFNKIQKIQNLETLINLQELQLHRNFIQRIQNLQKLTKLQYLWLNQNKISKFQNLQTLTKLKRIVIHTNNIQKIQGLATLQQLNQLKLQSNKLTKIQNIEKLKKLTSLWLRINQIKKIKICSIKQKIYKHLRVQIDFFFVFKVNYQEQNKFQKIQSLQNLVELKELYLCKKAKNIESNKITKIQNLNSLIKLNKLTLNSNQIDKIQNLQCLKVLKELNLSKNKISKIQNLQNSNLNTLILSYNKINKLQNLQKLINLQQIDLTSNKIQKIQNFQSLTKLKNVNLKQNNLKFIQGLDQLLLLSVLDLGSMYLENCNDNKIKLNQLLTRNVKINIDIDI